VLREDNTEVEITESIDYADNDLRYEMEGDKYGYDDENLGEMGYQKQEFDEESGELVSAEDDDFDVDYEEDYEGDNEF